MRRGIKIGPGGVCGSEIQVVLVPHYLQGRSNLGEVGIDEVGDSCSRIVESC